MISLYESFVQHSSRHSPRSAAFLHCGIRWGQAIHIDGWYRVSMALRWCLNRWEPHKAKMEKMKIMQWHNSSWFYCSPCTKAKIPVRTPCQKNFRSIDFFEFYQSKELISKHQYMRLLGRSISTTKLNWSFGNVVLAIVKVLQSNIPAMAGPDRIARHNQLRNVFYHNLVAAGV